VAPGEILERRKGYAGSGFVSMLNTVTQHGRGIMTVNAIHAIKPASSDVHGDELCNRNAVTSYFVQSL
jgi:hypothetical protein